MTRKTSSVEQIAITKALTLLKDAKRPIPDFITVAPESLQIDNGWLIKYRNGRARTRVHLEFSLIPETQQEQDERLEREKGPGFGLPLGAPDPLTQRSALKLAFTKSRSKFIDVPVKEGDKKTISTRMLLQRAKRPIVTPSLPTKKRMIPKSTHTKRRKAPAKLQQTISPLRHQPNFHTDMAATRSVRTTKADIASPSSAIPDPILQEVLGLLVQSQSSLKVGHHSKSSNMHGINHLHNPDLSEEDIQRPSIEPIMVTDLDTVHPSSADPQSALQSTTKGSNVNASTSDLLEAIRLLESSKANNVQQARSDIVQTVQSAQNRWTFEKTRASDAILKQDIWRKAPGESIESSLDMHHKCIAKFVEPIEEDVDELAKIANVEKETRIDTPTDPAEKKADTDVDVNLIASILAGMKDGEILQPVA